VDRWRDLRDDGIAPLVRDLHTAVERVIFFETVERRFCKQARFTTVLAGLSGLYMLVRLDLWDRFMSLEYWWMHAMVAVGLVFTLMLFVAESITGGEARCILSPHLDRRRPTNYRDQRQWLEEMPEQAGWEVVEVYSDENQWHQRPQTATGIRSLVEGSRTPQIRHDRGLVRRSPRPVAAGSGRVFWAN